MPPTSWAWTSTRATTTATARQLWAGTSFTATCKPRSAFPPPRSRRRPHPQRSRPRAAAPVRHWLVSSTTHRPRWTDPRRGRLTAPGLRRMTSEAQCLARLAQARQALRDGMEGEALAHARQAAEWFPDALVVRMTLGFALSANGLHDAAELVFKQAREHDPAAVRAYCTRLGAPPHDPLLLDSRAIHLAHDFARRRACDWRSHDYLQRFADWIDHAPSRASCGEGLERGLAFHALALGLPLPLMRRLNRAVTDSIRLRLDPPAPRPAAPRREGPLRLAYLSHNFGQHPK